MAKREIRCLAKQLSELYIESEAILSDAGLVLQDTALSEEEQKSFSKVKSEVDSELSLLSVALSAAAQGKLKELIDTQTEQMNSFLEPLKEAVNNLAEESIDEQTKTTTMSLIAQYNAQISKVDKILKTLRAIEVFAYYPKKKTSQKRYVKSLTDKQKEELTELLQGNVEPSFGLFVSVEKALANFESYVEELSEGEEESTAGDLDE